MKQSMVVKIFIGFAGVAAIGGVVVLGLTQSTEVRGASEMAVQETVARVDGVPETLAPAHEEMEDWRAYMLGLSAEDYTTYTDPVHHFSFVYPTEFHLSTDETAEGTQIVGDHVTFPLRFGITVHPLDRSAELVEELAIMGDEYESESPEGATSNSLIWINERHEPRDLHDGHVWFGRGNDLYHIVMQAPDLEWLDTWMREFVHTNVTLTPLSDES